MFYIIYVYLSSVYLSFVLLSYIIIYLSYVLVITSYCLHIIIVFLFQMKIMHIDIWLYRYVVYTVHYLLLSLWPVMFYMIFRTPCRHKSSEVFLIVVFRYFILFCGSGHLRRRVDMDLLRGQGNWDTM